MNRTPKPTPVPKPTSVPKPGSYDYRIMNEEGCATEFVIVALANDGWEFVSAWPAHKKVPSIHEIYVPIVQLLFRRVRQ